MIQVKENLTEEQIKQFSTETREFGVLDYVKGGLKNGAKNLVARAAGLSFRAGVIYIEKVVDGRTAKFTIKQKSTGKFKSLGDANDKAKEMLDEMKKNSKPSTDKDGKTTQLFAVKVFPGRAQIRYSEEVEEEMDKMAQESKWVGSKIKI